MNFEIRRESLASLENTLDVFMYAQNNFFHFPEDNVRQNHPQ